MREVAGYSIVRDIVGGGMADLYVALDEQHNRVVLRLLKEEYARDRRIHKNFLKGVKILSLLRHPNIVRLIKSGKIGKVPYMVLELIEARTMRDLILHQEDLLVQNPLSLIRQMAMTLYFVHSRGFIHLDFKPENLMVQDNGHVVLLDFDLAMERKNKPIKIRQVPGTPAYLAPEVQKQGLVDECADIYSFGVTCYEMLCYHKPFEDVTIDKARLAQLDPKVPARPIHRYKADVPRRLETIVLKCLAKDPMQRYPSMSLVVKDLEALI
ncbi:MAG: serine/threonine protein kinase [Spartobacteria bacterium]|nr:serine/threonine protein kinase [Spartobacteria bacterium]